MRSLSAGPARVALDWASAVRPSITVVLAARWVVELAVPTDHACCSALVTTASVALSLLLQPLYGQCTGMGTLQASGADDASQAGTSASTTNDAAAANAASSAGAAPGTDEVFGIIVAVLAVAAVAAVAVAVVVLRRRRPARMHHVNVSLAHLRALGEALTADTEVLPPAPPLVSSVDTTEP